MAEEHAFSCAVVVAHPDDEILWCGGQILENPDYRWSVVTLCRGSDTDRRPRFKRCMQCLGATGAMGDLDDEPGQDRLLAATVEQTICELLPPLRFGLLLTHGPRGEYTRHRRHEECCRAVVSLWQKALIRADELWLFAYEDGMGAYVPRAVGNADKRFNLAEATWCEKRRLITDVYGFARDSWEARATPRIEAFHSFQRPDEAGAYIATHEAES